MKRINLEHLNLRLPADRNFVEFVNSSANSNIIALCKSLFPPDRAVLLYGYEISYSGVSTAGAVYYNEEIFFIDPFVLENPKIMPDLCIREVATNVVYMSGDELPAYIERKMFPVLNGDPDPVVDALRYYNLIRFDALNYTRDINDSNLTGTIQLSTIAKHVWMSVDVELAGSGNAPVCFPIQGCRIPDQSLGFTPLLLERVMVSPGSPPGGIVAEDRYRLFVYDNYLCVAKKSCGKNFDNISKCATFDEVRNSFDDMLPKANFTYRIILNHQTLLQL